MTKDLERTTGRRHAAGVRDEDAVVTTASQSGN